MIWLIAIIFFLCIFCLIAYNKAQERHEQEKLERYRKELQERQRNRTLTDAEMEAIRQADDVFDIATHNAIQDGTYNGPLPEHIVGGHWTDIYPDIYRTKIGGINFAKGISSLAGTYFDARLIAEPDNKYDPNAIEIIHAEGYKHLGYIPSDETSTVREFISNQLPYPCRAYIEELEDREDENGKIRTYLIGKIIIQRPNVSPSNI